MMTQTTIEGTQLLRHSDDEDSTTSVLLAKGIAMVVLCCVSLFMGLIPIQLAKWFHWTADSVNPRSTKVVSLLLGFGGGVLLSTTFIHVLPEVSEGVDTLVTAGSLPDLNISLAETFMCTGFFLMYLVEELVHTFLKRKEARMEKNRDSNTSTNELVENGEQATTQGVEMNGHCHSHSHIPMPLTEGDSTMINSIRGLLIVLGLSVHELFEGLAIGLESSTNYVWYLFASVSAHKFVIAFCIGVELITSKTKLCLTIVYICAFSVVTPLGIAVGMVLTGGGSAAASGPAAVILQGMATGTLMYVVFFEILYKNREGLNQYLAILVGFLLMLAVQLVVPHEHDH